MMESLQRSGGRIYCSSEVEAVIHNGKRITQVVVSRKGLVEEYDVDYCISSIPIDRLTNSLIPAAATETKNAASSLSYRSIIFVVLFLDVPQVVRDNWIYVQDPAVCFNRFMDMASWNKDLSPPGKTSLVFEVTCNAGDESWKMSDDVWISRVQEDFIREFGLVDAKKILGGTVVKKTHAYPVYSIDYKNSLNTIKKELQKFRNLELIGRNGMFRYNNMDHSIASGIAAARNFLGEKIDLNAINLDGEYHEEKRQI